MCHHPSSAPGDGPFYVFEADDKGVPPPKTLSNRGTLLFGEVFVIHVVVGINPTAQHDVCASTVHYSSYLHHHYSSG